MVRIRFMFLTSIRVQLFESRSDPSGAYRPMRVKAPVAASMLYIEILLEPVFAT